MKKFGSTVRGGNRPRWVGFAAVAFCAVLVGASCTVPPRPRPPGAQATQGATRLPNPWTPTPPQVPQSPAEGGATAGAPGGSVTPVGSNFDVGRYLLNDRVPESSAWEPSGNFRAICEYSHLAYDDPIVYPGQAGQSHLHMFFGNTLANANSTYESLRTTGSSTCHGGPINRSAYWMPALIDASGKVVTPDYLIVYYKGSIGAGAQYQAQIRAIRSMPAGLRMIAGYDMANPSTPTHFSWACESGGPSSQQIPNCGSGVRVGVSLTFPTCWDGRNLDSANHRSHLAYRSADPHTGHLSCPATHPVMLPEFTLGAWFSHDGNSRNWHLSSDQMPGMTHANGSTFHSDWFGAWDPTIQDTWVAKCINDMLNCQGGQIGNGQRLLDPPDYTGPHTIAPPPH